MDEIARLTTECLKSHDFCKEGKEDERGSRLCRDNVSYKDDECQVCLKLKNSKKEGEDSGHP